MIPWQQFERDAIYRDLAPRLGLYEEFLHYVERGPSMAEIVFKCPMLEVANERQFFVTQQGGDSSEFKADHIRRIDGCLASLNQYFCAHAGDEDFRAITPPKVDHVGLWTRDTHDVAAMPDDLQVSSQSSSLEQRTHRLKSSGHETSAHDSLNHSQTSAMSPSSGEDFEATDIPGDQLVRAFLSESSHRSGRMLAGGAARAPKSIKQRRREYAHRYPGMKALTPLLEAIPRGCETGRASPYSMAPFNHPV